MYAPVVVFAYNRAEHLQKTMKALAKNEYAMESNVFVFVDGPKHNEDIHKQKEVCATIELFATGYFRSVTTIVSKNNKGLATSIIGGVTEIIEKYGKVIVLEDDSVTNPGYLRFMNEALEYFENDKRIWSVGGYVPPLNIPAGYCHDIIMTQRSSSIAWGTWKERWKLIDWDVRNYNHFRYNFMERREFNMWGEDRASMLDDQMNSRIDSWAIRFDYAMFTNGMYNITPIHSFITNIGSDGSGTHDFTNKLQKEVVCENVTDEELRVQMESIDINEQVRQAFCEPYTWSKLSRIKRYCSNCILYLKNKKKRG